MFFRRSRAGRKRRQKERMQSDRVPMLPNGCGYMGKDFGAPYIDSQCFGGRLYDLDNCNDDGCLYEPMEYKPCPQCNHEAFLENCIEAATQAGMNAQCRGEPRVFVAAESLKFPQDHESLQAAFFNGWDESREVEAP